MGATILLAEPDEISSISLAGDSAQGAVLEQLDRIVQSSHFRFSKRYPSLLRFIVAETLAGRSEAIKERTLGVHVFGRSTDYDTNVDPVVRISAGEVRKRIAQYYQSPGHDHELRIEIPLGSYVPRFYRPAESSATTVVSTLPPDDLQPDILTARLLTSDGVLPSAAAPAETVAKRVGGNSPPPPLAVTSSRNERSRAETPRRRHALHLATLYVVLAGALLLWAAMERHRSQEKTLSPAMALVWGKIIPSPERTLMVLGVHSFDAHGADISALSHVSLPQPRQTLLSAMTRSDMVHLGDLTSFSELANFLTHHNQAFRTRGAADTTLPELRQGAVVLIGGFNNIWTKRLTQQLRYRLVTLNGTDNVIQDSQNPATIWSLDVTRNALANSRDYAILSSYLDPETGQQVLIIGGIGSSGTEAAAAFLTSEEGLQTWYKAAGGHVTGNVELVISTDVIEGKFGTTRVVASQVW